MNVAHDPAYYCKGLLGVWTLDVPQRPWTSHCPCGWRDYYLTEADVADACRDHQGEPA